MNEMRYKNRFFDRHNHLPADEVFIKQWNMSVLQGGTIVSPQGAKDAFPTGRVYVAWPQATEGQPGEESMPETIYVEVCKKKVCEDHALRQKTF